MFKVGDLVRIKSCNEIVKINQKMGLAYPNLSIMEKYCNKIGKVTRVIQYGSDNKWY